MVLKNKIPTTSLGRVQVLGELAGVRMNYLVSISSGQNELKRSSPSVTTVLRTNIY